MMPNAAVQGTLGVTILAVRLLHSFPLTLVASVAFGVACFFVVFGLIAHFRHGAELAVSFPLKLLLWLAPGVICGLS